MWDSELEGFIATILLVVFAFIIGKVKGHEDEQKRIYEAFRLEGYDYERFYKVLEKFGEEKQASKLWAKFNKRRNNRKK